MTWRSRALVLIALVTVIGTPVGTLHPLIGHPVGTGESSVPPAVRHAAMLALLVLAGASLLPLANFMRGTCRWGRAWPHVRLLARVSQREVTEDGYAYWLAPIPGVRFFTAGLIRPRVYATYAAREQLPPEAFSAALLHEREHQRRHDVAWRSALTALEAAFLPLPPIRRALHGLALDCELSADRAALDAGARREHLFEAMAAAASARQPEAAVGLSSTGTFERMRTLAEPSFQPTAPGARPIAWVVVALALLPMVSHLLVRAGAACL